MIDVLKLKAHQATLGPLNLKPVTGGDGPQVLGELRIPAHATVLAVARLLKKKPVQIVLDLMEVGVFASITQEVGFETIAELARRYGYIAKRSA